MPLAFLVVGMVLLFLLIAKFKVNALLSLLAVSFLLGMLQGMAPLNIVKSIETGVGSVGHLFIIIGLGAIIGRILSEVGAAQSIALTLVGKFGKKYVMWAVLFTSFVIGITLFWEVSFVVLIPIVFTVALAAEVSLLSIAVPMLAAITATHCFLPPHPGPVAVIGIFHADLGLTLLYGLIISVPAVLVGLLYTRLFRKDLVQVPRNMLSEREFTKEELPSFKISIFSALLPVLLILLGVIAQNMLPWKNVFTTTLLTIGNADCALFIACLVISLRFALGRRGVGMQTIGTYATRAFAAVGPIMFVICGGGAFKQVIIDTKMSDFVAKQLSGLHLSPLILAWLIAAIIRVAVGSSTVTVFAASAVALPLLAGSGIRPELFVLAIASGSVFCDPPTDAAWWMAKEYLNLSMAQNVKLMTGLTTVLSIIGLGGVLTLNLVV